LQSAPAGCASGTTLACISRTNWRGCDILLLRSQRTNFACEAD
jgi:hypothetical protein